MIEGRLPTVLRRTKTSDPNRQVKELPVCVSEKAYFAKPAWVKVGFDLLQLHVRYKRDYLVSGLKGNGALDNRMASYADAMVATAGLLSAIQLPQVTQGYWTEHSERAVIPTGLSVLEAPPSDKDILGRWKSEGSDTYARSYGGRVARLQAVFAEAARSSKHYEMLDEREIARGFKDWLVGKDKLDLQHSTHLSEELASQWKRPLEIPKGASEIPTGEGARPERLDEPVSGEASSQEEGVPSAKKLKTIDREASYVIVASFGGVFRLHRAGSYGCWMGRKRDFRDATEFDTKPPTSRYTHVCKLCWPPKADDGDSESGEASSAHTGDSEEPWLDATWEGWVSGLGPPAEGAGEPTIRQIDAATGIDFNRSLYDFIRERM